MDRLHVSGLCKEFDSGPVLDNVSFSLEEGASLAVIGPSGCGKSTLLSILSGLKKAGGGSVELPAHCRMASILQDYGLFPWKTVYGNLALPLQIAGAPRSERQNAVRTMLEEMDLTGLERRFPAQLSGGQRQRVAIGRALVSRPNLLLMDEPFAALDAITRERLQELLLDIWKRRGMSFILVTHNVAEAVFLGRHIMVLRGRPARSVLWLDNPCFGDSSARTSAAGSAIMEKVYLALNDASPRDHAKSCPGDPE